MLSDFERFKNAILRMKLQGMIHSLEIFHTGRVIHRNRILVDHTSKVAYREYIDSAFICNLYVENIIKDRRFDDLKTLNEALEGYEIREEFAYIGDVTFPQPPDPS